MIEKTRRGWAGVWNAALIIGGLVVLLFSVSKLPFIGQAEAALDIGGVAHADYTGDSGDSAGSDSGTDGSSGGSSCCF